MHGFGASSVIALATLAVGVTAQLKSAFQWGWGYQAVSYSPCPTRYRANTIFRDPLYRLRSAKLYRWS